MEYPKGKIAKVIFKEEGHTYTNEFGNRYTSATTVKKLYLEEFDTVFWTAYKAVQDHMIQTIDPKYRVKSTFSGYMKRNGLKFYAKDVNVLYTIARRLGLTAEQLHNKAVSKKHDWDNIALKACAKGSAYHLQKENAAIAKGFDVIDTRHGKVNGKYYHDLSQLPDGFYPELLVYNNEYMISGQVDKCILWTDPKTGIRYYSIDDYKTSKKIAIESKYKMLYPLNNIPSTDFYQFAIQINLYAFMLESWGFKPVRNNLWFTHCKVTQLENGKFREDELIPYRVPYLNKTIKTLLDHFRDNFVVSAETDWKAVRKTNVEGKKVPNVHSIDI